MRGAKLLRSGFTRVAVGDAAVLGLNQRLVAGS